VRTIAACALALLFATCAVAESLVVEDALVKYTYSFDKRGPLHFCDLATTLAKPPMVVKLTAAFITDETKPKNDDVTVAYIVEAFVVAAPKGSKELEPHQIKVVSGRIVSDIFNSEVHASKIIDKNLGATYRVASLGSVALFTSVVTVTGIYKLAVDFENDSSLVFNVKPTPEMLDATTNWNKCGIAIMKHQSPAQ
jgi:hypothetical protein